MNRFISQCFLIFVVLGLISCNTNKHVNKTKETTSTTTETASTSTITSEVDTCVTTKEKELSGGILLAELLAGDTLIEESPELIILTTYDPIRKSVVTRAKAKPQMVNLKFKKTEIKQEKKVEKKIIMKATKDKEVKREAIPWWILVILILIMLASVTWRLYKKKPGS
jgi:hypothetical protein